MVDNDVVEKYRDRQYTKVYEKGGPVRSVSLFSTGIGEGHYEHIYGSQKPALWWIFRGRRWVTIPLNVFVIEHEDGVILFDAGMDRKVVTDPNYWPEGFTGKVMSNLFKFHIGPEETVPKQLHKLGYSMDDINKIVFSHLHADHVGDLSQITNAELIVDKEGWQNMLGPHPDRHMVFRNYIDLPGLKWNKISLTPINDPSLKPFTHAYDIMGDGSMVLLQTPGHLEGSLSMLVRSKGAPPMLLIGDLSYGVEFIERYQFPATGNKKELKESFSKVIELKKRIPDLVIIASHDTGAAEYIKK